MRDSAELAREAAQTHQGVVEGDAARDGARRRSVASTWCRWCASCMALHPRLEVALLLSDGYIDLVDERIDVALRVGRLVDSTADRPRGIARVSVLFCAPAPRYLAQHGTPRTPQRARAPPAHPARAQHASRAGSRSARASARCSCARRGRLTRNDGAASVEAAVQGLGVISGPEFELSDEVRDGRLRSGAGGLDARTT